MMSNTITVTSSFETWAVEPPQALGPSRLSVTKTLFFKTSNMTTTRPVVDEAQVERIAEVIASYRISGPRDKYKDVMEPKMLDTLRSFVAKQEPVNMVVPAYPFKSPNHESKVLGPDPDVGERMSLQHFNSIGAGIEQVYPPGGHVTIVSDGVCYNDLLGVSDEEVFDYAKGLRRITASLGLKHLRFTDIFELVGSESPPTTAEEYATRIGELKERLFVSFLPSGYDFNEDIKKDNNALLTYRGYMKFLELDLATVFREKGMGKSAAKKYNSRVARGMIERGKAFSALVASKSPLHIRLSIHMSDNTRKISVALLPHNRYSTFPVTPWHSTPYLDITNVSLSLGRKPTDSDVSYKICEDELGLKFLCADVPMYSVIDANETVKSNQQVKLEPLYPFGLKVQVPKGTPITRFSLDNVTELAKLHSPIVFEGLDLLQYTSESADDFRRMADDGLSLSFLHEETTTSISISKVTSSAQVSRLEDLSPASEPQTTFFGPEQGCLMEPSRKSLQGVGKCGYCTIHEVPKPVRESWHSVKSRVFST